MLLGSGASVATGCLDAAGGDLEGWYVLVGGDVAVVVGLGMGAVADGENEAWDKGGVAGRLLAPG